MAKQRHVSPRLKIANLSVSREQPKFDEVVSAAAGPKLRPCSVLVLRGNWAHGPIGIQDRVLATILERGANPETRLGLNRSREPILVPFQILHRNIEHRHFHTAGDVHADRIRNHRVFRCQHSANGQAIANMRVRHEGSAHGHRQQTGSFHLHHGLVFEPFAPLPVFDGLAPWRWRSVEQRFGKLAAQAVFGKC